MGRPHEAGLPRGLTTTKSWLTEADARTVRPDDGSDLDVAWMARQVKANGGVPGLGAGLALPILMVFATASGASPLTHEQLQVRPLGTPAHSCHRGDVRLTPSATRRIAFPNPGASTGCSWLGPAIVATRSVQDVVEGQSPAGALLVAVDFLPKDSRTLRALAAAHPDSPYAVVLLGKVLGTVTGSQFMDVGTSNPALRI